MSNVTDTPPPSRMQGLSVYIAAPFQLRELARDAMLTLEALGFPVTSSWLRVDDMPDTDAAARMDLADVDRADVLVLLNPEDWRTTGTGGRHSEFGYAHARGKHLFIVGVRSQVFHHLSNVTVVTGLPLLVPALRMRQFLGASAANLDTTQAGR